MKAKLPHEFIITLRKYHLQDVLLGISRLSGKAIEKGVYAESYQPPNSKHTYPLLIVPWDLLDISYYACLYCEGILGALSFYNLLSIVNLYKSFSETLQAKYIRTRNSDEINTFLIFIYTFFGEQRKFQTPRRAIEHYNRETHILHHISANAEENINVDKIVQKSCGLSCQQVSVILYLLHFVSCRLPNILDYKFKPINVFTYEDLEKVVNIYSTSIQEVRNSKLERQIFYSKPFLKLNDGCIICVNTFLPLFLFESSSYWICRNHFMSHNSQHFINTFGRYFEAYAEELFNIYLDPGTYNRIPESSEKRADWQLLIEGYTFLIEQKSALPALAVQQQHGDLSVAYTHFSRNWLEAIQQLHITEHSLGLKKAIKIILTYDNYFKAEALDHAFNLPDCTVENDGFYWLVSIEELEKLLHTRKNNASLFRKIIAEKIESEAIQSAGGREFEILLDRNDVGVNHHIKSPPYNEPHKQILSLVKKSLGRDDDEVLELL